MKVRKYLIAASVLVISVGIVWASKSSKEPFGKSDPNYIVGKETLAGLPGVWVVVAPINPEVEKYGLSKSTFQTDVELQLRRNGLKVLSADERFAMPGRPFLWIEPLIIIDGQMYVVGVQIELMQDVRLVTNPRFVLSSSTWHRTFIGSGGLLYIQGIRSTVKDIVDEFCNDYLAANPKEAEAKTKN